MKPHVFNWPNSDQQEFLNIPNEKKNKDIQRHTEQQNQENEQTRNMQLSRCLIIELNF